MKKRKIYNFPVIIEKDESGYYIGKVPALRSCYTQAKTLPNLYKRLNEVVELSMEGEVKKVEKYQCKSVSSVLLRVL